MESSDIRIVLIVIGVAVLGLIYWLGRPHKAKADRKEPSLPWADQTGSAPSDAQLAESFAHDGGESALEPTVELEPESSLGNRPQRDFDMIISLHVMARDGGEMSGAELIVATEKASLIYGAQGLFHRLVDGKPELGPIFSVVNRVEPGRFDLSRLNELRTPGVSFFMALPCALPALEAWDRMLPAAQRLAGLLNADVYDDQNHLLGRQRIASIREELRGYDRRQESRMR
jgi:cell division protein ZipA